MNKRLITAFIILAAAISGVATLYAQQGNLGAGNSTVGTLDAWKATSSPVSGITQRIDGNPIVISGLSTGECLTLDSNNQLTTTTCGSGGSGNSAWTIGNGVIYNATSTNFVGVGTSTPLAKFSVVGTAGNNAVIDFASSTGVSILRINPQGYVGIGTTTPQQPFVVVGSSTLTSLSTADCDVKATASGGLYCGTDATGAGGGITSLNGETGDTQTFATSSTGSHFSITSSGDVHTFNIPVSSASNFGLLSPTDWSTFNNKVPTTVTLTAGAGLTGGGDLSANRTFTVGAGTGITVNADDVAVNTGANFTWTGSHSFATTTLTSLLIDGTTASGTLGQLLQSTGTSTRWATITTSDVAEGTNQYFTNQRVSDYLYGSSTFPAFANYWTLDSGNVYRSSGNVGIGSTSPLAALVASSTTHVAAVFNQAGTSDILQAKDAGATVFTIKDGGNVGIGTTNPAANDGTSRTFQIGDRMVLQNVVGSQLLLGNNAHYDGADWKYVQDGTAAAIRMSAPTAGDIGFYTAGIGSSGGGISGWDTTGIKMTLTNAGNLGIGITNPTYKLQVYDGDSFIDGVSYADGFQTANGGPVNIMGTGGIFNSIRSDGSSDLTFRTGGTDRARADSSGFTVLSSNLTVNVGSITSGNAAFSSSNALNIINDSSAAGVTIGLARNNGSFLTSALAGDMVIGPSTGDNILFGDLQTGTTEYMRITSDGRVGIGTTTPLQTLVVNGSTTITNLTAANCDIKANSFGGIYCGTDATGGGGGATTTWSSLVQAWIYPSPAGDPVSCNADEEFKDGRQIHTLKPEYLTLNATGTLIQVTEADRGCNGYTASNATTTIAYSKEQFITVSGEDVGFNILMGSSSRQTHFITTAVALATSTGFTGIELDIEGYAQWSTTTGAVATFKDTFIPNLADALHAVGKKLMVDIPAVWNSCANCESGSGDEWDNIGVRAYGTGSAGYYPLKYEDLNALPVDYWTILAYDFHTDYGGGSPIQPHEWVKDIVNYAKRHIDVNKLVIGIPSYGYGDTPGGFSPTIYTYTQMSGITGFSGATRVASSSEMVFSNGGTSYVFVDEQGLNLKREYIESLGIKRVSIWHLGGNQWFTYGRKVEEGNLNDPQPSFWKSLANNVYNFFTGNLGIGTSTPLARFSVVGTSTAPTTPLLDIASSTGSSMLRVTYQGNVGIGTTTPSVPLVVVGPGATSTVSIGAIGKVGCIAIRDTDNAGWTYVTALNGVLSASMTNCDTP